MRYQAGRAARLVALSSFSLLFGLLCSASSNVAFALDSPVKVSVTGSTAPDLQITNLTSPVTVTTIPVTVQAIISNLTQVQVYVDGAYSLTIPLTVSAESFSYDLNLNEGTHQVEFIGISAYTSNNPQVSLSIAYTPVTPPSSGGNSGSGDGKTSGGDINQAPAGTGGVIIGDQPIEDQHPTGFMGVGLPNWIYQPLVFFDIINPNSAGDTPKTIQRAILMLAGLFFLICARQTLWLYRKIRYDVLRMNKRPLLYILRRFPLLWIRLFGAILVLAVFVYI